MKTPTSATPDSQRAMQMGKMRPSSVDMSNCKNPTSQAAKAAGTSRPAPPPTRKGR